MYRSIYVPVDNSSHALAAADLAIAIARRAGAEITGSHVYAARLHDRRFRQMEGGLPERYLREDKLLEQRDIHDDLITRGLQLIADCYLDVFARKCAEAGLAGHRVSLEGRNWQQLVADIARGPYDLVVMGALGLGSVASSEVGSVSERVARRIDRDLLVVRRGLEEGDGGIAVALDGSPRAFGGLRTALALGRAFGRPVEAVCAFDPLFHYVAFSRIAGVLSPEAASVFRFKEQEKLHEEVIDTGLERIYRGHLDVAARIARAEGVEIRTVLLAGKPFEQVLTYARKTRPWLLVVGRTGVHSDGGLDLGSITENVLRRAPCNVLLSAQPFEPPIEDVAEATMAWTAEAEGRLQRVPDFARGMARRAVLEHAARLGHTVVTSDVIDACLMRLRPHGRTAPGDGLPSGHEPMAGAPEAAGAEGAPPSWEAPALARLNRIGDPAVRDHARLRIEKAARRAGQAAITETMVEGAVRAVGVMLGGAGAVTPP